MKLTNNITAFRHLRARCNDIKTNSQSGSVMIWVMALGLVMTIALSVGLLLSSAQFTRTTNQHSHSQAYISAYSLNKAVGEKIESLTGEESRTFVARLDASADKTIVTPIDESWQMGSGSITVKLVSSDAASGQTVIAVSTQVTYGGLTEGVSANVTLTAISAESGELEYNPGLGSDKGPVDGEKPSGSSNWDNSESIVYTKILSTAYTGRNAKWTEEPIYVEEETTYHFYVRGGAGGGTHAGVGGVVQGKVTVPAGSYIWAAAGGSGNTSGQMYQTSGLGYPAGIVDGGIRYGTSGNSRQEGGGGAASVIYITSSNTSPTLKDAIIVAGGGGGCGINAPSGNYVNGGTGTPVNLYSDRRVANYFYSSGSSKSLSGNGSDSRNMNTGGSGGGWWGGGSLNEKQDGQSGVGGSGFVYTKANMDSWRTYTRGQSGSALDACTSWFDKSEYKADNILGSNYVEPSDKGTNDTGNYGYIVIREVGRNMYYGYKATNYSPTSVPLNMQANTQTLTITGEDFNRNGSGRKATVTFGNTPVLATVSDDGKTVTCPIPAYNANMGVDANGYCSLKLSFANADHGMSTLEFTGLDGDKNKAFYYYDPPYIITSVSPTVSSTVGGGTLTIKGSGFKSGSSANGKAILIKFWGQNDVLIDDKMVDYKDYTDTEITCTIPPKSSSSQVKVSVSFPNTKYGVNNIFLKDQNNQQFVLTYKDPEYSGNITYHN